MYRLLVDTVSSEQLFDAQWFPKQIMADIEQGLLFSHVFNKILGSLLDALNSYLVQCYDPIGVLIMIHITRHSTELMHSRQIHVPPFIAYLAHVESLLWERFNHIIQLNIDSVRACVAKNMGPMLVARSQQIHEGLAAGEKAKAAAGARAAAVEAKLADLGQAIAQMKASSKEEREREAERIRRDTEAEFARIQQHAQQEIESAGKLARIEVQRFAAKLAIDLAEQKVRARMSAQAQTDLLNNFIGEIAGSTSHLG